MILVHQAFPPVRRGARRICGSTIDVAPQLCQHVLLWSPLSCGKLAEIRRRLVRKMAIRKRSETIHLRVGTISKACLEGLANATGRTATRVIEDLITEAASKYQAMDVDSDVDDEYWSKGEWSLLSALELALVPDQPMLTKLRIYFLAGEALSPKERIIAGAIVLSPHLFSGATDIFNESERVQNKNPKRTVRVNMDEIARQTPILEDYAEFRVRNKLVALKYEDYLKMIEENTST